jgi:hypothetical protein
MTLVIQSSIRAVPWWSCVALRAIGGISVPAAVRVGADRDPNGRSGLRKLPKSDVLSSYLLLPLPQHLPLGRCVLPR